jgi:large subunit ribosomal protein L6
MSKIGKKPIEYDKSKVTVTSEKGGDFGSLLVKVKGSKGELSLSLRPGVDVKVEDAGITLTRKNDTKINKALHGLYRSLIANMIQGVTEGYEKKLDIQGVGYRGAQTGESIELNLGFSHSVKFTPPDGITVKMEDQNTILVSGVDKQKVGEVAAKIREIRKPEPYKGKGIRYMGEQVKRKAGKANITAS